MSTSTAAARALRELEDLKGSFGDGAAARKLALLRDRGRVERTGDGRWRFRPQGIDEAAYAFTREMARNLLQTAAEVQRLLDQADKPAP